MKIESDCEVILKICWNILKFKNVDILQLEPPNVEHDIADNSANLTDIKALAGEIHVEVVLSGDRDGFWHGHHQIVRPDLLGGGIIVERVSCDGIAPHLGKSHPHDSHVEEMHKETLCIIDRGY